MDVKTTALFCLLLLCIVLSVSASFYRFVILNDYERFYDDYGEEAQEDEALIDNQ